MTLPPILARGADDNVKPGAKRSETPGQAEEDRAEPAEWATAQTQKVRNVCRPLCRLPFRWPLAFLGLTPQALCCRQLRRL